MERLVLSSGLALVLGVALFAAPLAQADGTVALLKPIGFSENAVVREDVREQCQLQTKVPDYIAQAAKASPHQIQYTADIDSAGPGRSLTVEIVDVSEFGNAFTGRQKSMTVTGELREGGQVIGSFRARRQTMGGMFGGYKGNCSFLHRCAKSLGKDIVKWLNNPGMDDNLAN